MPHLHNEPGQHDFTVSAFIVRKFENQEFKLLLHKHKHLNSFMQPGGHIELNENPWAALNHELVEETGYDLKTLKVLQPSKPLINIPGLQPIPALISEHGFEKWPDHYHIDLTYVLLAENLPVKLPEEGESSELRWFNLQEIIESTDSLIIPNIKQTGIAALTSYLEKWIPIPSEYFSFSI